MEYILYDFVASLTLAQERYSRASELNCISCQFMEVKLPVNEVFVT